MPRGVFITLEGGDAAGKSTQAAALEPWLVAQGRTVVRTREPGGTQAGAAIRGLLLDPAIPLAARAEALLYAADRAQHVAEVVRPALARGDVVLQDRYLDSSVAYQGAGRAIEPDVVRRLSLWAADGLLPDRTLLLDLDPALARARLDRRGGTDRMEDETDVFHRRVRDGFLALAAAEPDRFVVIDAGQPVDLVQDAVRAAVLPLIR